MYGINGEFRRFCFDSAVITFGTALEAELDSVEGKTDKDINRKRARMLDKWLDRPLKYREPMVSTPSSRPTSGGDVEQQFTVNIGDEAALA